MVWWIAHVGLQGGGPGFDSLRCLLDHPFLPPFSAPIDSRDATFPTFVGFPTF